MFLSQFSKQVEAIVPAYPAAPAIDGPFSVGALNSQPVIVADAKVVTAVAVSQ